MKKKIMIYSHHLLMGLLRLKTSIAFCGSNISFTFSNFTNHLCKETQNKADGV